MAKRRSNQASAGDAEDRSLFEGSAPTASGDATGGSSASSGGTSGSGGSGDDAPPRASGPGGDGHSEIIALHETAQAKYLNYALSVITSRALPDVRDGLKPVQRRILYSMGQQRLTFDAKPRKCSTVVGMVMGNYHPHGDTAIYDSLVRMAQPFSLRGPLIDGTGNFGSLDGDAPAAMRYTECRLAALSNEMLAEIGQQTVHFRPNYDGTKFEPVVLPARVPNLLLNGGTGIAVGMATNIPPHNLVELLTACIKLLEALVADKEMNARSLCRWVKGPDFPTAGQILNSPEELKQIYETGSGSVKLRATWELGPATRAAQMIHVTSVPYAVNKSVLVERIGDIVLSRKLPPLLNVRDLSADDVRIELEIKKDTDPQLIMAYLFKHTPLQNNFAVNLTCLVPTENPEVGRPERLGLREVLWHFLHFRLDVVTRRLAHELDQLNKRIHILEGFEKVFDALDEIIRIIRKSDGKADAADKIMKRFDLDAEQTDAILELKLYRLARLEILIIREELEDKRKRARAIEALLAAEDDRWALVAGELEDLRKTFKKDPLHARRTEIVGGQIEEPEFSEDDFIVAEDSVVIITRDGWVKRQREVRDLSTQRLREGDAVLTAQPGSTRATIAFFSNFGVCYTARIIDIPATTGYGEPIQKLFRLKDGEQIIQALSLDRRAVGDIRETDGDHAPAIHGFAATSDGYALRFGLETFVETSTRAGRKYARPAKGSQVVGMELIDGHETIIAASRNARATLCPAVEVNYLAGPGKGVQLIKLSSDDRLLGFIASTGDRDLLTVETNRGAQKNISTAKYEVTGRGGRGREIQKNGHFAHIVRGEADVPALLDDDA